MNGFLGGGMIKLKVYKCPECEKELEFDVKEFQKNPKKPMPFYCENCKKYFGWEKGGEQEALDYLKQRLNLQLYKEKEWCIECKATGNKKCYTNDFELCKNCEGFGVLGEALKKEKLEEKRQNNKSKGVKIDNKISNQMRRLGATGLSIKDGKVIFKIPEEVKKHRKKVFEKKKKARKKAKKARRRQRKR